MKYLIVFEKAARNYSAYVPDLPGCVATGRTKAQVEKRIREAIDFHISGLMEDGDEIPAPRAFAEYEEVAVGSAGR
jgi:predicted RNase H-like HicB family nuclease